MTAIKETNFSFPKQTSFYKGKVRDVYTIDNRFMAMVVTDRISAFDVVLPEAIPFKGQVLNQIAAKFLNATKDIVPNWVIAVPDEMVTIGRICEPFKVEMVVRGYLAGNACCPPNEPPINTLTVLIPRCAASSRCAATRSLMVNSGKAR